MNKLKELINKYKNGEITDKKKIENMIYILVMLIILVIGINKIWFSDKDNSNKETITKNEDINKNEEENNSLEERLKNILGKVEGVSNVDVLINYLETKQIQPVYNIEEKEVTTNENDTQGGNRNIVEKNYSKEIVYEENNNNKNIIVQREEKPKIAGIIVVASFNKNENIKQEIIKAVANVANISEYKVQVLNGN